MIRTLIGEVVEPLGLVHQRGLVQPPLEPVGEFRYRKPPARMEDHFFALRPLDVRRRQPSFIGVCFEHDGRRTIGHVAHLELAHNGSLWMVAEVAADDDELAGLRCSPRWRSDADGRHATVEHVGLTRDPGQTMLRPITVLDGRLSPTNERRWRVTGQHGGMIARAAAAASRPTGEPLVVHDADVKRGEQRDRADEMERRMIGANLDLLRARAPMLDHDDAPTGGLRYGPPAPILDVR